MMTVTHWKKKNFIKATLFTFHCDYELFPYADIKYNVTSHTLT